MEKVWRENECVWVWERSLLYGVWWVKFLGDAEYEYSAYLDGSLCGDAGFDLFGFGKDDLLCMCELEFLYVCWVMLGIVGVVVLEFLECYGVVDLGESVWWKVGAAKMNSDVSFDYFGL